MLEWRLAHSQVITYSGDLTTPPDQKGQRKTTTILGKGAKAKTIRGKGAEGDSSDDDDW